MDPEEAMDIGVLEQALALAREVYARAVASGEAMVAEAEGQAIARLEEKLVLLQTAQGQVAVPKGSVDPGE
jgi:hypothetical protein